MKKTQNFSQLVLLSLLVGLLVGTVNTAFGKILLVIGELRSHAFFYLIPFLALAGITIIFLYQRFGEDLQQGMKLVLKVGRGQENNIPKRLVPLVAISTWLTHLFGGSAGREGVAVQIGATISHQIGKRAPIQHTSHTFVVMGIAAGFAGLFQTPLAAIFFALEILAIYRPSLLLIVATFIASFTASTTSSFLGLEKFSHPISLRWTISLKEIILLILLGLAFGVIGNLFVFLLKKAKNSCSHYLKNLYQRIFLGGLILSVLLMLAHQGRYSGLGTNLIEWSLLAKDIYAYDWLLKIFFTIFTLAIGFQGGEVTPLFAIGASSGVILANLLGLPIELAAALGYASVFASATNTLIGPIFIGAEVFGFENIPYFILVTGIAYFINRKQSIYQ